MDINCAIDLIGVSISDGVEGFKAFLSHYPDCSFEKATHSDKHLIEFTFRYKGLRYEGTYHRSVQRIIVRVGGLTQYKETSRFITHWSLLQLLVHHYGNDIDINKVHFALDIPYRYTDVSIRPAKYVSQTGYSSSKYFDASRRKSRKGFNQHDFIIYDKCRKCQLTVPLTRIELRIKVSPSENILRDTAARGKLAKKVHRKFAEMKIKVGRGTVKTNRCDWNEALEDAINYIKSDESAWKRMFSHRQEEITETSAIFRKFMRYCAQNNIYTYKPHLHKKGRSYLQSLKPQQRVQIQQTITGYNAYDKDWYKDPAFGLKKKVRWKDKWVRDHVLFSLTLGETQSSIAEELGILESTLSRWLNGYVKIRDTKFLNIFKIWE